TAGTITTGINIGNNIGTGIVIGTGFDVGISLASGGITLNRSNIRFTQEAGPTGIGTPPSAPTVAIGAAGV
ncbi:hypothetical protein, partial [Gordonibacter pamelaeae]|uniref:hypothetical protein n=1 Tax=Gordonibacter pamelaeae TaxID=471189 RepID=UPI001D095E2C